MQSRIRYYLWFLLLLIMNYAVHSQSFTASVDRSKVGENEQFQVTFTFSGEEVNALKDFKAPDFNREFLLLSGPNHSTSMQIINGAVSASRSFSFYLQPRSTGSFTIGSASIIYKEQTLKSEPIRIEVVRGSSSPQQNQRQNQTDDEIPTSEIEQNLFIKATADKQRVYQGEQVTVTYKLYTRLNLASQMSVSKLPQYQGFWAEELETSNNISFDIETVNGQQFRVGVLKKVALFPSKTGELSVTPLELVVPVAIRKKKKPTGSLFDDFFDDPFFGRTQVVEYNAKSNTIRLNVVDVPEEEKPASFRGAVGRYEMRVNLDKKETKTNDPVTLKVTISGTGNIKLIDLPELQLETGFEKYEPKINEEVIRVNRVTGKKEFEYLIVPRLAGTKELPSIEFSYFDPERKRYEVLREGPMSIKIEQGEFITGGGDVKEDLKLLGDDIRFIKTSSSFKERGDIVIFRPSFWAATVLPLAAFLLLAGWKRRNDRLNENITELRYSKAERMAKKRLKKGKELMAVNKAEEFYTEISMALTGYLEDKFNIPKSEFMLERAVNELRNKKVSEGIISDLEATIEKCEFIRFAPARDAGGEMVNMYERSVKLIVDIEKEVKGGRNVK
jgi:hypothetical protein